MRGRKSLWALALILLCMGNAVASMGSTPSLAMLATLLAGHRFSLAERQSDQLDDYSKQGRGPMASQRNGKVVSKHGGTARRASRFKSYQDAMSAMQTDSSYTKSNPAPKKQKAMKNACPISWGKALNTLRKSISGFRQRVYKLFRSVRKFVYKHKLRIAKMTTNIVLFTLAVTGTGGAALVAIGCATAVLFAAMEAKKMLKRSKAKSLGAFTFNVVKAGVLTVASALSDPGILDFLTLAGTAFFDWMCGTMNDIIDMSNSTENEGEVFFEVNSSLLSKKQKDSFERAKKTGKIQKAFTEVEVNAWNQTMNTMKESGSAAAAEALNYFSCGTSRVIRKNERQTSVRYKLKTHNESKTKNRVKVEKGKVGKKEKTSKKEQMGKKEKTKKKQYTVTKKKS